MPSSYEDLNRKNNHTTGRLSLISQYVMKPEHLPVMINHGLYARNSRPKPAWARHFLLDPRSLQELLLTLCTVLTGFQNLHNLRHCLHLTYRIGAMSELPKLLAFISHLERLPILRF